MKIEKIIEGCLKRDATAEKQFYYLYATKVFAICKRYSKDDHQAKDYMQECFQKIYLQLPKYDPKKGKIDNWISRVVSNLIISEKRKQKITVQEYFDEEYVIQDDNSQEDDLSYMQLISGSDILLAIRSLPAKYADVFNLYIFENRKHKEIGNLIGITESSSRSRLSRAKFLLRAALNQKILTHLKEKKSETFIPQT